MTRDYPNNEENMDAPLVPFIADPTGRTESTEPTEPTTSTPTGTETSGRTDEDDIGGLRRDIAALRDQLERLETRMETEERR
ncbi:hypothetical protein NDI76_13960 [Halogeometricum sp. S1BR25-6]|uniref:Uncharacterized protein n=1 Tax=Halogeometricum salsisoli TaxID=2950536 RepID=A0ABU2GGE1_9EURY|nr:hypothetical protein [Halogeometricum sp. S1BR25-6]MDS0299849.1 hypothetical protein [Halogeometricum sp. S1BR25-6]